jgi:hypothetical protein
MHFSVFNFIRTVGIPDVNTVIHIDQLKTNLKL